MATYTNFVWLNVEQSKAFRSKWNDVHKMVSKWSPELPGDEIKIFADKKALEEEIDDLESLSLAAYRAMMFLRKQLQDGLRDLEIEEETYSG